MRKDGVPGADVVALMSVLVPWRQRAQWRAEWEAELVHARAAGASAGRLRLRALGSLQDALAVRKGAGIGGMVVQDVRQSFRMLHRRPGFGLAVMATLGLGIAAAVTVYTVVDGVLLRPPPFRDPATLVELHTRFSPETVLPVVMAESVEDWRAQPFLAGVEAYGHMSLPVRVRSEPEAAVVAFVTPRFLELVGAVPLLGRIPGLEETDAIVVAERFWREVLGTSTPVVGRLLTLGDVTYTVTGVLPDGFRYPAGEPQAWIPGELGSTYLVQVTAVARLREPLPRGDAQRLVDAAAARLQSEKPGSFPWAAQLVWLADAQVRPELQRGLWLLAGAVGMVLLIACVNAGNLLLVDLTRRERELAVRSALGGSRSALVRQLLLESLLLAGLSAGAGLLLARWSVHGLLLLVPPELALTSYHRLGVDGRAAAFASVLALVVALLYSLAPAVRAVQHAQLVRAGRASSGGRPRRLRGALVITEVALSVMLAAGAGLLVNSFLRLQRVDLGLDAERVLMTRVPGSEAQLADTEAALRALPGVSGVARERGGLPHPMMALAYTIAAEGPQSPSFRAPGPLPMIAGDSGYFRVLGIRLLEGRALDTGDHNTMNVVIDADLARRLWPQQSALGRRFSTGDDRTKLYQVVGVSADVRPLGPDDTESPYVIFVPPDPARRGGTFFIRVQGDVSSAASQLRATFRTLSPSTPVPDIEPVRDVMRGTMQERRFFLVLLGGFAALALTLAVVGLYGVIAHSVRQRTREIGIRMALGAPSPEILRAVLRDGMALIVTGLVLGTLGALATTRYLGSLLFGVRPQDLVTLGVVGVLVLAVAMLATVLPARRAAAVSPIIALRAD